MSRLCRLCAQNVFSPRRNAVNSTQASTQSGNRTLPNLAAASAGTPRRRSSAITAPSVKNVSPFQSFQLLAEVPRIQSTAKGDRREPAQSSRRPDTAAARARSTRSASGGTRADTRPGAGRACRRRGEADLAEEVVGEVARRLRQRLEHEVQDEADPAPEQERDDDGAQRGRRTCAGSRPSAAAGCGRRGSRRRRRAGPPATASAPGR